MVIVSTPGSLNKSRSSVQNTKILRPLNQYSLLIFAAEPFFGLLIACIGCKIKFSIEWSYFQARSSSSKEEFGAKYWNFGGFQPICLAGISLWTYVGFLIDCAGLGNQFCIEWRWFQSCGYGAKRGFEPKYWVFDLILLVYPANIHLRTRIGFLISCIVCRI
jgi:hypothetical protein